MMVKEIQCTYRIFIKGTDLKCLHSDQRGPPAQQRKMGALIPSCSPKNQRSLQSDFYRLRTAVAACDSEVQTRPTQRGLRGPAGEAGALCHRATHLVPDSERLKGDPAGAEEAAAWLPPATSKSRMRQLLPLSFLMLYKGQAEDCTTRSLAPSPLPDW